MDKVILDLAKRLGKSSDDVEREFIDFSEKVYLQYKDKLPPEKINERAKTLIRQHYKSELATIQASPAISAKLLVTGVSKLRDQTDYNRKKLIQAYINNANMAIRKGEVNEYLAINNTNILRSYDLKRKEVIEEQVESIPDTVEHIKDNIFVAPRETRKFFGAKENPNFGNEIPAHTYQRDVHGIAEIEGNCQKFTLLLRGKNADTTELPIPGFTYNTRVLNQTKEGATEYSLMDSPTLTKWIPFDWNPYEEGSFIENVLQEDFMLPYVKVLGELKGLAYDEFNEKAENKERVMNGEGKVYNNTKFNYCYFVEADLGRMSLFPPKENKSSRIILDDDSVEVDYESNNIEQITGFLSEPALTGLSTGEGSRAYICCYPKIIPSKDSNKPNSLWIDVFGILPIEMYQTYFNLKEYINIKSLDEY